MVAKTANSIVGKVRVNIPHALNLLGNIYQSPLEALKEYPENGKDAGAKRIWVVLEPGKVSIIDDGHGMVPWMLVDDYGYFKIHLADLHEDLEEEESIEKTIDGQRQRRVAPDFDVRSIVKPVSLKSLQWMMESVAFSSKIPEQSGNVTGMKGIGALAFRSIGDQAVWYTRPSEKLHQEWIGGTKTHTRPVFQLLVPTAVQLKTGDTRYKISQMEISLLGPANQKLESGTKVEISGIWPEAENALRPSIVADFLRRRFSEDIRKGLEITIVDRVTEEGKKSSSGREIHVEPIQYRGILLVDRTFQCLGQDLSALIYLVPSGKPETPLTFRHRGVNKGPITNFDEFQKPPFNLPKLTGSIEFPALGNDGSIWETSKAMPKAGTRERGVWQNTIWRTLGPEIERGIEIFEEKSSEAKLENLAAELSIAMLDTLREDEVFHDIVLGGSAHKASKGKGGKNTNTIRKELTTAVVFSEHHQGVAGVVLKLFRGNEVFPERQTGKGGRISFGRLPMGRYRVEMMVPQGSEPNGPTRVVFNISETHLSQKIVFQLETHSREPEEKKIPKLRIWPHPWDDIDEPFSIRNLARSGYLEINTAAEAMRLAIEEGDDQSLLNLAALYTAMGLALYGTIGDAESILNHTARLFANSTRILKQKHKRRR